MSRGTGWFAALAALVVVRTAFPLAALAASGHQLPGLPRYEYEGLSGDAIGFYATAREFIAAIPRVGKPLLAVLVLAVIALGALLVVGVRRGRLALRWALIAAVAAPMLVVTLVITQMTPSGAAVVGWPLIWSVPMLPLRALKHLDPDIAFGVGVPIGCAANAVTVVATAYVGLRATGRRWIGLGGGAFYALWPILMGLVAGSRGWGNGTWAIDAGLAMYTEPVSTALVTVALALLLAYRLGPVAAPVAGIACGLATLVKLSNGLLALVMLGVVVWSHGRERAALFAAGALTFAPAVAAYWPRGYSKIEGPTAEKPAFVGSAGDVIRNWSDSLLFSPRTLIVLVPLALLGCAAVRSKKRLALVVLPVLVNALFYTFYAHTADHPRFLFVGLPAVFVLWIAGVWLAASGVGKTLRTAREAPL
jgi:hypothetical protein